MITLVVVNSFSPDAYVWLFNTLEEATAELRRQFYEEVKAQKALGHEIDEDMEAFIHNDGLYAELSTGYDVYKDTTEWRIGAIQN